MEHHDGHGGHVGGGDLEPADLLAEMNKDERDRLRREVNPHEELRKQHMQFHEKHRGHEQM